MQTILTTEQMKNCEQRSAECGTSLAQLMDNAGEALARAVLERCMRNDLHSCTILAGKGNNGGDGFVAANHLSFAGVKVKILLCCGQPCTELAAVAFEKLDKSVAVMTDLQAALDGCDVIIDCVFGTGFKGELRSEQAKIFSAANETSALRIACDIPSGCDASNGKADPCAFKADLTVTFHAKKLGLLLSPAKYSCGEILTADIAIPEKARQSDFPITVCDAHFVKGSLPYRTPYGHKGTFGKLVAVCGSDTYIGAAGLSALGALRTGVGLCELCTTDRVISSLSGSLLECIYTRLESDGGSAAHTNADMLIEKSKSASCLLIGCGIGHTAETEKLIAQIVKRSHCPVVIDADGINSLAVNIDVLQKKKSDVILTPHPKELSRLCRCELSQVIDDPLGCAQQIADKYGVTVVAKSSETIVVTRDGCVLVDAGNTALSKGGSGDILAGMTASLIAQGCDIKAACAAASFILGTSARTLCKDASPRGILPTDILREIPHTLKVIEEM